MDFLNENKLRLDGVMPLILESLDKGNDVRFAPKGTSMLPMLRQGKDSVVISAVPKKLNKYDILFYKRANGQYVLHRAVLVGDTVTCIGDNQYEYERGIKKEQVIGVVTHFYRENKKCSVKAFYYKLYCVMWHRSRGVRKLFLKIKSKAGKIKRSIWE